MELRVLATTDIHMQLLGYDYVQDKNIAHAGLSGLSTLIASARAQAKDRNMGCILLDNGDFLQGSALGRNLASLPVTKDHPVVACLNHLNFSAVGIGNHDLDYGLPYLSEIAASARMPFISSNLDLNNPSPFLKTAVLDCPNTHPAQGEPDHLRIGLIAILPEQTAILNKRQLAEVATITPVFESVRNALTILQSKKADIVILLAHLGIEEPAETVEHVDDVRKYAAMKGIDAIIAGHTHRRLPGTDHRDYAAVDAENGQILECPTLMPGFDASDLAVLDLELDWHKTSGWRVIKHSATLRANTPDIPADPAIAALCAPAHHAVRAELARSCGQIDQPMHNYFSLTIPTTTCALVASAKHAIVTAELANHPEGNLPILATSAAHTAGGRAGPEHYLNIPAGPIYQRHLEGLIPYVNEICALRVTGDDLRQWLEHCAGLFNQLEPSNSDRPLFKSDKPTFDFDTIYGLDYAMDLTRPVGQRIVYLRYAGAPVEQKQPFALATSTFRATGGGGGKSLDDRIIMTCPDHALLPVLTDVLRTNSPAFPFSAQPWRFSMPTPVQTYIKTAPAALSYLGDIGHLNPQPEGTDAAGFARIRLLL